jgi:hypothetical protein
MIITATTTITEINICIGILSNSLCDMSLVVFRVGHRRVDRLELCKKFWWRTLHPP